MAIVTLLCLAKQDALTEIGWLTASPDRHGMTSCQKEGKKERAVRSQANDSEGNQAQCQAAKCKVQKVSRRRRADLCVLQIWNILTVREKLISAVEDPTQSKLRVHHDIHATLASSFGMELASKLISFFLSCRKNN